MGSQLLYAINIVGPIFLIICLGFIIRKTNLIDESFISTTNKLVYTLVLPVYLFHNISKSDFAATFSGDSFIVAIASTVLVLIISIITSYFFTDNLEERGAFVQVSSRGNVAYVGLALIENALGEAGTVIGAPLMAIVLTLYNFLILTVLTYWARGNSSVSFWKQILGVFKNPLIIGIFFGIIFSLLDLRVPILADKTFGILSRLSLPLALIGVGGSLTFGVTTHNTKALIGVLLHKNIIYPLVSILLSLYLGLDKTAVIVLFIIASCPSSISSFVIAGGLGFDTKFTASSIVLTTVASIFSIASGLILLQFII